MTKKIFVNCKDYNGHKNVKFIMNENDFRLHNPTFSDSYELISPVNVKKNQFTYGTDSFIVHSDWSVSKK